MAYQRNFALSALRVFGCAALACLCFLLIQAPSAFAQVDQGSITGIVQDQTGAVVPNAKVTLLNTDQGLTLETTADSSGVYTFSPVRIGHYSVTVTAPGFATTTQQNLTVNVSQNLRVNIETQARLPNSNRRGDRCAAATADRRCVGGSGARRASVNNLPLNGRNFTFLAETRRPA